MTLHASSTGAGPRSALLVHGMLGSAESWWRVSDALVERGFRVVALDLPGHGRSAPDRAATIESVARDIATASAASGGAGAFEIAMGHSFGGLVVAAAAPQIRAKRFIFVDAPFSSRGERDVDRTRRDYEAQAAARTPAQLGMRPDFTTRDIEVEARAAELFDPATAASIAAGPGGQWWPPGGSLVIRAEASDYVTPALADDLRGRDVDVVSVAGAKHTVWRTHFDAFWAALGLDE